MDTILAMRAFVRVVETGSFSAVAKELDTTQATVSKRVAALEAELGVRLLVRGNRMHSLTETGQNYYERAVNILQELEEAEAQARSLIATPRGVLRVIVPSMFGSLYVAPVVPEFLATYPEIQLDLKFTEKMVDLVEGGIDVAIRLGDLKDSSLIAKPLGKDNLILVASPRYLAKHGEPQTTQQLNDHNCLIYSLSSKGTVWSFTDQPADTAVQATGNFQCDTGSGLMEMLLADAGISFMPYWLVEPYIASGKLVHILQPYHRRYPINAVYTQNRYVPLKTKSFLNFMTKTMRTDPVLSRAW